MRRIELNSYLQDKNIYITNKKIPRDRSEEDNNILRQIDNIVYFHNQIGEYKENLLPRIGGSIGKEINNYNNQIILLDKYLNIIEKKKELNSVDFYFINRGESLINLGRKALEHIYLNNFKGLIERSMRNYEVCLTRVDEGNLKVELDGKIVIGTIRYLTYNLKEHDIYSYIKKLKRRGINLEIEQVINYYIELSKLKDDSGEYLKALVSFPNEEFRIIEKYIQGKFSCDDKEILESLYAARKVDDKGIII